MLDQKCERNLTVPINADLEADPNPMKRAMSFCQSIAKSRIFEDEFAKAVQEYTGSDLIEDTPISTPRFGILTAAKTRAPAKRCSTVSRATRGDNTCRILTNGKVLSEGVDVPALDAIVFMHPR